MLAEWISSSFTFIILCRAKHQSWATVMFRFWGRSHKSWKRLQNKPESSPNFICGALEDEVSSGPRGTAWLLQSTQAWFYPNHELDHALARRYLVGAVQGADEKGDLLHHRQVLLQVLQLLEEPRWPQVDFILGGKKWRSEVRGRCSIPPHRNQPNTGSRDGCSLCEACPAGACFLAPALWMTTLSLS